MRTTTASCRFEGGVAPLIREKLDARRTAEGEIVALRRQIERSQTEGAPGGYPSTQSPVKVPGKEEYIFQPSGTNNPQAMLLQQEDGYRQKLRQLLEEKQALLLEAEYIIAAHPDGKARVILRYYYCQAWTDERIAAEIESSAQSTNVRRNEAVNYLEENFAVDTGESMRKVVEC